MHARSSELARALRSERPRPRAARARAAAGRSPSHPDAEEAARRLLARPRTPPLTPAQAETLAIVAYLQPVSRPEIARIRGVSAESATATLLERGLIEEAGPLAVRRRPLPHDAAVPEALRPRALEDLPESRVGPDAGGEASCASACCAPARPAPRAERAWRRAHCVRQSASRRARDRLAVNADLGAATRRATPRHRPSRAGGLPQRRAASCPQAASMSRPRVRRTVARAVLSSAARNAAIASRPEPS